MGTTADSGNGAATTAPEPASAGFGVVTVIPSLLVLPSLLEPEGHRIALMAVISRSLTLSGNGT
jgi:hypothetical protein